MKYNAIKQCRIGKSENLQMVLSLGNQALTGVFPKSPDETITSGPLELGWCPDSGLLQLMHSYEPDEMYGDNYGYRSGLNQSMVDHLTRKISWLERRAELQNGDTVLDIGSNDCTSLKAYSVSHIKRIGIDPTGRKFKQYYPDDVKLVPDFFNAVNFKSASNEKAKIVTSIAMFYDLEDPIAFARDVASILHQDGVWHLEQSYMPSMLRMTSYDTICHEHLEYYSLEAICYIMDRADLKVVDVSMNAVNGGSFAVTVAHKGNTRIKPNTPVIEWLLAQEDAMGLYTPRPYRDFEERVYRHRKDVTNLIRTLTADGKKVLGYGASTKGNVLLQFCNLTAADIPVIAEVNEEKFGRFTPGTNIPIVSEAEARAMKPDYFFVLPWHFKEGILKREKDFLNSGGHFIFPFPEIEII
ncbi:methyltransferase [Prodigiosinella confusarubida]|uniref:Methyltransferase n=1 Tax=Serratia sp. (strain ATCC 39006) TaxID=104623 RepID=A0A2I5TC79_SERS3|nr:class I SAM-dependent methyltransferase [Serratia sp. ATCC 39006]AUH02153.1 methyltransferase [Serratia sp. ATCC 39006]AUH06474.1 methyltransferase [Serratia sp. ATCC 39006]